ncbi:MAG: hypothetical protein QOG41_1988 [Thermoleophilaceae bacterium]|nr:hypothetical protein [Thermoleophilaceae bacterium]
MPHVDTASKAGERRARPAREDAEPAVVELLRTQRGRLMSVARRYSSCHDDADDAYQRAVEILLLRPPSTDVAELLPWMKTVVKHEAFAVARQRTRHGLVGDTEQIEPLAGLAAAPDELAERRDRLRLGAEALGRLKPQEVRALLLRAEGLSYREICDATGWSYTKVNRCLSEGRQSFVDRVAGIEAGVECERLAPVLSSLADGEASGSDLEALRPHLAGCLACRERLREYRRAPSRAAAVALPAGLLGWLRHLVGSAHGIAAGKAAAVAASAALVVGGGAAVVGHGSARHPARAEPAPPVPPRAAPLRTVPPAAPAARSHPRASHLRRSSARRVSRPAPAPSSPKPLPTAAMKGDPAAGPSGSGSGSAASGPRHDAPASPAPAGPPGGEFSP